MIISSNPEKNSLFRVNIGCGMSPTPDWLNFDNSPSVRLARYPLLIKILSTLNLLRATQLDFIRFCQHSHIIWADVTKHIPLPSHSVEVIYSSHMLEHLDRNEVLLFLNEAKRILVKGGILRLAIPDLNKLISSYAQNGDADAFMESMHICKPRPKSFLSKLRILTVGTRHHQWLYDSTSLANLLKSNGFAETYPLIIGQTRISNPGQLNLHEDAGDSMYLEAVL
jgi:predicted SAM-dependent methyltransferase